jgi:hypothetical protein
MKFLVAALVGERRAGVKALPRDVSRETWRTVPDRKPSLVMAGLDPAIPLIEARPCHMIGIAGSSPAMTDTG